MLARIQEGFHGILKERKDDLAVICFYEELPLAVGGMVGCQNGRPRFLLFTIP